MLFSTPFFLFVFLTLFFGFYWLVPARRGTLLLGSMIFYGWSEPVFLVVVLLSSVLDWGLGWRIAAGGKLGRYCLVLGVSANVGLLVVTKYAAFGVQNLNQFLDWVGLSIFAVPTILLPLGISFIVFEKITYLVDLHRKTVKPTASLLNYLNYVFLFPKLLAGPIVKYHDIDGQLSCPVDRYEDIRDGMIRFIQGLAKKVFLADTFASFADGAFALPAESLDPGTAWLGLLCFTLQIYFDFSGYTDMAIGLARMMGFRLMENFRDPYLATSFTDFWRRWHISLSSWIKEYLYIPLGGNRLSTARTYFNLWICFLLSGIWHGASWNFVIWGSFHGLMLVFDRFGWLSWSRKMPRAINILLTFMLVSLSWVFFRCETFSHALVYYGALFGAPAHFYHDLFFYPSQMVLLAIAAYLILRPLWPRGEVEEPSGSRPLALAGCVLLLILCIGKISVASLEPFLYFRF